MADSNGWLNAGSGPDQAGSASSADGGRPAASGAPGTSGSRPGRGHLRIYLGSAAGVVTLSVLLSVVDIALWLGIARACRRGRSGARVAGTVLFAVHTIGVLGVLASSEAGLDPAKVLTLIGWLIGCGAVAFLWQRPSSAFFAARRH